MPKTLAEKVWDDHLVVKGENGSPDLLYIDLHLVHEVTSPQAFDGLRAEGRPVRPPARGPPGRGPPPHRPPPKPTPPRRGPSKSRSPTSRAAPRSTPCAP